MALQFREVPCPIARLITLLIHLTAGFVCRNVRAKMHEDSSVPFIPGLKWRAWQQSASIR